MAWHSPNLALEPNYAGPHRIKGDPIFNNVEDDEMRNLWLPCCSPCCSDGFFDMNEQTPKDGVRGAYLIASAL